jgi:hypothetical protein
VPQPFRAQAELVLQFGYQLRVPIPDLEVDEEGITGTLSFARRPFWCRVPWSAVYAIAGEDGRGFRWAEDMPRDGATAAREAEAKRPKLRAVGKDEPAPASEPSDGVSSSDGPGSSDGETEGGEGVCALCSTRWPDDAGSCAVCGASRDEAFRSTSPKAEAKPAPPAPALAIASAKVPAPARARPALAAVEGGARPKLAAVPASAKEPPSAESADASKGGDDEPPPEAPPPKRPNLRLVR